MKISKKIAALIIFVAVISVLGYNLHHILGYQDNVYSKAVFSQFYDLPKNTLDAVWIGPSSVQEEVIGPVMYDTNGMTLYSLAVGNMPFNSIEPLIKEVEKTQDPAVYLVDIRDIAYDVLSEVTIRRTADNMKWSRNRINTINSMTDDLHRFHPEQEINLFEMYFSFVKYHTRWAELTKLDFSDDCDCYHGYWLKYRGTPMVKEEIAARFKTEEVPISEENEYYLDDFLNFCDSFDKKVVFTCTPNCLEEEKFGQYNYVKTHIIYRGYEVWDFNDYVDEMGIDYNADFTDAMHLNVWGAKKLSAFAAEKLDNIYDFADHRGDDRYTNYKDEMDRFNSRVKEIKLTMERDMVEYLKKFQDLDGEYMLIVSVKDNQGQALNNDMIAELSNIGFTDAGKLLENEYHSFAGICNNNTVVCSYIGTGEEPAICSQWLENRRVSTESYTMPGGNYSTIKLGNVEYSKNLRGFNFVVVNNSTGKVVDSCCFDTDVPEITCMR